MLFSYWGGLEEKEVWDLQYWDWWQVFHRWQKPQGKFVWSCLDGRVPGRVRGQQNSVSIPASLLSRMGLYEPAL